VVGSCGEAEGLREALSGRDGGRRKIRASREAPSEAPDRPYKAGGLGWALEVGEAQDRQRQGRFVAEWARFAVGPT